MEERGEEGRSEGRRKEREGQMVQAELKCYI